METVGDSTHTVLTDTITEVGTLVATETGALGLEVLDALNTGQIGTGQVSGADDEVGDCGCEGSQADLGELARCLCGVRDLVHGESLLPSLGEIARDTASELSVLLGVLLSVRGEECCPGLLLLSTLGTDAVVDVIDILRNVEGLVSGETELRLDVEDIVLLQSCANGKIEYTD